MSCTWDHFYTRFSSEYMALIVIFQKESDGNLSCDNVSTQECQNTRRLYFVYAVAVMETFPCKIVGIHVGYRGLAANVM